MKDNYTPDYVRPPILPERSILPWFDAHCHLSNVAQEYPLEKMLTECRAKGISTWFSNALSREEIRWHTQASIPGMRFSAGIHPTYHAGTPLSLDDLEALCKDKKIFAIGEIGLDNTHRDIVRQLPLLRDQLSLARMYDLPVIFHILGHYDQFYKLLSDLPVRGIWHGYYANKAVVAQFSKFDLTFSMGSVLINSLKHDIINAIIDRGDYLIETDAPYNLAKQDKSSDQKHNPLIKLLVLNNMVCRMNGVKIEALNQALQRNIRPYLV
jgi:TatD DNase family protein